MSNIEGMNASSSERRRSTVNVIGDIFVDIIATGMEEMPSWEKDTLASIRTFPGGSALNTAMHFAYFVDELLRQNGSRNDEEVNVALYSAIGSDNLGKICFNALNDVGRTLQNKVQIYENCRSGSCIVLSGNERRGFITDRGVINTFQLQDFEQSDLLSPRVTHTHIGGYYNCPGIRAGLCEFLQIATGAGQTISINPQYDANENWDGIKEIAPYITYLIANESETCKMAHKQFLPDAIDTLIKDYKILSVIVTQGAKGATLFSFDESSLNVRSTHVPGIIGVNVVDTTGAGDAFIAGILGHIVYNDVNLSSESSVAALLRDGCTVGAAACTVISGSAPPSKY